MIFHTPTTLKSRQGGFTLIEFVVIIIVFAIIAAVSLFNFRGFTQRTRLENLAQQVALTVREAQVLGSTRTALDAAPADLGFSGFVGVYIPYDNADGFGYGMLPNNTALQNAFAIFRDINNSKDIDDQSGEEDEIADILQLEDGDSIAAITGGDDPQSQSAVTSDFYILFKRPSLNAIMYSADDGANNPYLYATIVVSSANGEQRSINITAGGQISVVQ